MKVELYIDKEFVRNFWGTELENNEITKDFQENFLQKASNLKIVTNYKSMDEIQAQEEDLVIFELFNEKLPVYEFVDFGSKEEWIENATKKNGGFKLFFMELTTDSCDNYGKTNGYEFISTGNFEKVWGKFIVKEIKKSLIIEYNNSPDIFKDWSDLKPISQAYSNSIIIVDKYILSDKRGQEIKYNLIPLIKNIIPQGVEEEIDILIISEKILESNSNKKALERVKKIHKAINDSLAVFNKKINLSIVSHDKTFYPMDGSDIHDRIIYTNYYTIECGGGFNLYKNERNRITVNSKISISFNFQPYEMNVRSIELEQLKKYLKKVERLEVREEIFKYYPNLTCKLLQG